MEENRKKVPFYNQIEKYMIVSMFLVMTVIIALNVVRDLCLILRFPGANSLQGCFWYGLLLPGLAGPA